MPSFREERLATLKTQLTQVDEAISVVLKGGVTYSLDSGQTRQSVTRATLGELRAMQTHLTTEIEGLDASVNGSRTASVYVRPGY